MTQDKDPKGWEEELDLPDLLTGEFTNEFLIAEITERVRLIVDRVAQEAREQGVPLMFVDENDDFRFLKQEHLPQVKNIVVDKNGIFLAQLKDKE